MGVKGLWRLLLPIGRRISIETLEGKILAIDASIWLTQFLKAMRDPETGSVRPAAHLLGFFRRLCKLLFHGIRPVLVFDGSTPEIKLRELALRRKRREQFAASQNTTAVELLAKRILQKQLKEQQQQQQQKKKDPSSSSAYAPGFYPESEEEEEEKKEQAQDSNGQEGQANESGKVANNSAGEDDNLPPTEQRQPAAEKATDYSFTDADLIQLQEEEWLQNDEKKADSKDGNMNDWDDENVEEENFESDDDIDTVDDRHSTTKKKKNKKRAAGRRPNGYYHHDDDDTTLNLNHIWSLPAHARKDAIEEAGRRQRLQSRREFMPVAGDMVQYSQVQITNFLRAAKLKQNIVKMATANSAATKNTASETTIYFDRDDDDDDHHTTDDHYDMDAVKQSSNHPRHRVTTKASKSPRKARNKEIELIDTDDDEDDDDDQEEEWEDEGLVTGKPRGPSSAFAKASLPPLAETSPSTNRSRSKEKRLIILQSDSSDAESESKSNEDTDESLESKRKTERENQAISAQASENVKGSAILNEPCPVVTIDDDDMSTKNQRTRGVDASTHDRNDEYVMIPRSEKGSSLQDMRTGSGKSEPTSCEDWDDNNITKKHQKEIVLTKVADKIANVGGILNGNALDNGDDDEIDWEDGAADEMEITQGVDPVIKPALRNENPGLSLSLHGGESLTNRANDSALKIPTDSEQVELDDGDVDWEEGGCDNSLKQRLGSTSVMAQTQSVSSEAWAEKKTRDSQTAAALLAAQATAANLTNWAGRAFRRALEQHANDTGVKLIDETTASTAYSHVESANHPLGSEGGERRDEPEIAKLPTHAQPSKPKSGTAGMDSQYIVNSPEDAPRAARTTASGKPDSSLMDLLEEQVDVLHERGRRQERDMDTVTDEMKADVIQLIQLFGIPYIEAPAEAEAQCVELERLGLVDGIVTEDSDVFVFGGHVVFKNIFDDQKYVEVYRAADAEKELALGRNQFVALAMLLGGDYTEGVKGVGIVNGMEILQEFDVSGDLRTGLTKFREWLFGFSDNDINVSADFHAKHRSARARWTVPDNFPADNVITAYQSPVVDNARTRFSWGVPDVENLCQFAQQNIGWTIDDTKGYLRPVVKKLGEGSRQMRIDSYFMKYEDDIKFAKVRSKRLRDVFRWIQGPKTDQDEIADDDSDSNSIVDDHDGNRPSKSAKSSEP